MKNSFLSAALFLSLLAQGRAENWPQWRGPYFNGSSTEQKIPASFSKTNNVKWTASMPGPSASTPVVWGNNIFVSSGDDHERSLHALCLDRTTGKILWNQQIGVGYGQDEKSNFSSPSPATDGKVVVFLYGNGEVAAFDVAGKKLWARSLQKDFGTFAYQWTYGASPLLYRNQLIVQVLQRDQPVHGRGKTDGPIDSFLLAVDPQTGKDLWKHVRPCDAKMESHEAYTTPFPFEYKGRNELVIAGGDYISGHDVKDGHELWHWGTWNPTRITHWRLVPSPVAGGDVLLACAPKGSPIYAVKAGGSGALDDSSIAWKSEEREVSSDVSTPLFYKDRFYVVNGERRTISRVNPATGKADWIGELNSRIKIEASPTAADDKIYFQNFRGEVFVVAAADQFKLLGTISMGDDGDDQLRACIPISRGNLFIRTGHKLYCIGN